VVSFLFVQSKYTIFPAIYCGRGLILFGNCRFMCTLVGFCYHWGDYQCLRGHCPVFCFRSFSLSAKARQ